MPGGMYYTGGGGGGWSPCGGSTVITILFLILKLKLLDVPVSNRCTSSHTCCHTIDIIRSTQNWIIGN